MGFGHRIHRVRDPRADVVAKTVVVLLFEPEFLACDQAKQQDCFGEEHDRKSKTPLSRIRPDSH